MENEPEVTQLKTYGLRPVSADEYDCFWNQALGQRSDCDQYDWSVIPGDIRLQIDEEIGRLKSSCDELWIETNTRTGDDPALFGKRDGTIYLLARWGTDAMPLRTEKQIMRGFSRRVERQTLNDYASFQWLLLVIGNIFGFFGLFLMLLSLTSGDFNLGCVGLFVFGIAAVPLIYKQLHKKKGPGIPFNEYDRKGLNYVKLKLRQLP